MENQTANQNNNSFITLTPQNQANQLWQLFNDKIIDLFVSNCQSFIQSGGDLTELSSTYKMPINFHEQYLSMKRVLQRTQAILAISNSGNDGWRMVDMDDRCTFAVRTKDTFLQMKSKGILSTNVKSFLYLAYLVKLYTACLPFCKEAHDIKQVSRLQKVGFVRLSIPIPLIKDRCTFLRGIGFDRIDKDGTVCIFAEGITQNKQYLQKLQIDSDKMMKNKQILDLKHFAISLKCIGPNQTEYTGYALVDHHIPFLPERFIMFVAKQMAKYLFNYLMKQLSNFEESVWAKQARQNYSQNSQFYDWIQKKVKTWVEDVCSKK